MKSCSYCNSILSFLCFLHSGFIFLGTKAINIWRTYSIFIVYLSEGWRDQLLSSQGCILSLWLCSFFSSRTSMFFSAGVWNNEYDEVRDIPKIPKWHANFGTFEEGEYWEVPRRIKHYYLLWRVCQRMFDKCTVVQGSERLVGEDSVSDKDLMGCRQTGAVGGVWNKRNLGRGTRF